MSTPQTITRVAPRLQIRRATILTALALLAATTATIAVLALAGANQSTAGLPVTASQATGQQVFNPRVAAFVGPRHEHAALKEQTTHTVASGRTSTAGPGNQAVHYICQPDKYCLRCLADNFCTRY
jgi:hypothetical protein